MDILMHGLEEDHGISSANALEIPQSSSKPTTCYVMIIYLHSRTWPQLQMFFPSINYNPMDEWFSNCQSAQI